MSAALAQERVGIRAAFHLARTEKERLLERLEGLVNLTDSLEDFEKLKAGDSAFLPTESPGVVLYPGDPGRDHRIHRLVLGYRNMLRELWRGCEGPEKPQVAGNVLGFLLDLAQHPLPDLSRYFSSERIVWGARGYLLPNWWTGEFSYQASTNFSRAVFLLWRESWRAKICPLCRRYFIAGKPTQRYCGSACSTEATQSRALNWWREHGAEWRAKRIAGLRAKRRIRKSQRKRGK